MKSLLYVILLSILIYSCEKEVSVSPPDELPPQGTIVFNTNPSGFNIHVNGKNRARSTPDSLRFLDEGVYEVTLKKNLFIDSTFTISLGKDERINLDLDYSTNPHMLGKLFVESEPTGASIFFDDSNTTHKTPFTFSNLVPGNYNVVLKSEGHKDINFIAPIESYKKINKKFVLVDTTLWLELNPLDFGIEADNLTCITIDQNNLVWIGSRDGLILYDGNWKLYNPSNSYLTHNVIHDLGVTQENELFIATQSGFSLLVNKEIVLRYTSAGGRVAAQGNGFPSDITNGLFVEKGFPFFFATEKGLGTAKGFFNSFYLLDFPQDQPHEFITQYITSVWRSSLTNEIFIGTQGSGLIKSDPTRLSEGEFDILTRGTFAMPTNSISDITEDQTGNIWIAFIPDVSTTISTLVRYSEGSFNHFPLSTADTKVNKIFIDSRNIKWVGTEKGLFYFTDNVNNRKYLNETTTGLKLEKVNGIAEDSDGNIWITTFENGMFKIKDVEKLLH